MLYERSRQTLVCTKLPVGSKRLVKWSQKKPPFILHPPSVLMGRSDSAIYTVRSDIYSQTAPSRVSPGTHEKEASIKQLISCVQATATRVIYCAVA